jgi:3-dehydroquinate dehydratase type I
MFTLCISIPALPFAQIHELVEKSDMAEIRLDLVRPTVEEVKQLFSLHGEKMIAVCRPGYHTETERAELLKSAIDAGCGYVDLEIDASVFFLDDLIPYAKTKGCKLILSYHNYEETPDREALELIIIEAMACGADMVKIVTKVTRPQDMARLLALYANHQNIIAFGMGDMAKISRPTSLFLGASFTYVSPDGVSVTAPGQFSESEMRELLGKMR